MTTTEALEALLEPEVPGSFSITDDAAEDPVPDWAPLDQLILAGEPSPPRDWSSHAPVLIGFDAASVAEHFPEFDRVIVGRTGAVRRPVSGSTHTRRSSRSTGGLASVCPARGSGIAMGSRRTNSRRSTRATFSTSRPAGAHASTARWDLTTGGRLVRPLSDVPDPFDDLTRDPEDDVGDPHEPCATTSVWPEKPPRTRSAKGRPGTYAGPRLPGPPARSPGGEPEAYAVLAEGRQIMRTASTSPVGPSMDCATARSVTIPSRPSAAMRRPARMRAGRPAPDGPETRLLSRHPRIICRGFPRLSRPPRLKSCLCMRTTEIEWSGPPEPLKGGGLLTTRGGRERSNPSPATPSRPAVPRAARGCLGTDQTIASLLRCR